MVLYQVCFVRTDRVMIRCRAANKRARREPSTIMFTCLTASKIEGIIEEYINFDFDSKFIGISLCFINLKIFLDDFCHVLILN